MSNDNKNGPEMALTTVRNTEIQAWGEREVVRELADRLMAFHPAYKEVGRDAMFQAAQLSVLMGASPLPGVNEIHIYKDTRGGVVVQTGINYWRRRAVQNGGIFWVQKPRPMTESERIDYGVMDGEIAAICVGVRFADYHRHVMNGKLTVKEAGEAFGATGVGVAHTETYTVGNRKVYKESKNGRPLMFTAEKRAETDICKKLFPFVPGERANPGLGLIQRDDGMYEPVDTGWEAAGFIPAESDDVPPQMALAPGEIEAINEELFGPSNSTSKVAQTLDEHKKMLDEYYKDIVIEYAAESADDDPDTIEGEVDDGPAEETIPETIPMQYNRRTYNVPTLIAAKGLDASKAWMRQKYAEEQAAEVDDNDGENAGNNSDVKMVTVRHKGKDVEVPEDVFKAGKEAVDEYFSDDDA